MIRACLFDMGRVLVEFSHDQMLKQMAKVCGCESPALKELLFDSGRLLQYERGEISEDELHELFEQQFACQIDRATLNHAASDIFQEKQEMIPLLQELQSQGIRLVLLSNTSRNHFEFIRERFTILDYFDSYILSYEVRALKPDPAIYQAAIAAAGYPAESCFFTDDLEENIVAARTCGLHAEQFIHRDQLIETLRALQLPIALQTSTPLKP